MHDNVMAQPPGREVPVTLAVEEARKLAQAGRWREAIDGLQRRQVLAPSAALQRTLVDLRIAAGRAFAGRGRGRPDPVTGGGAPLGHSAESGIATAPGELPEVGASELTTGRLREALSTRGALVVRGLLDSACARDLRVMIDRVVAAREQRDACEEEVAAWYVRSAEVRGAPARFFAAPGETHASSHSVWAVDSPLATARLVSVYQELGLAELLNDYFGEPALLSVKKWVLRKVAPNNGAEAGWHQDGRFLGEGIATLNLWLSLSDCGRGAPAPGVEVASSGHRDILPTGTHGADFDWTVGQQLVEQVAGDDRVIPRFAPGDALLFDHFNLHRTAFGDAHTLARYAIEAWFFAQSRAPLKQQPVFF